MSETKQPVDRNGKRFKTKTSAFLWIEVDLFVQGVEIHEIVCNKRCC